MGSSDWSYYVPYQPDLNAALQELRQRVFLDGDYWWAAKPGYKPASAYPDRPTQLEALFEDDEVQQSGTHSILDMDHVLADGEPPGYCTVRPVSAAEALAAAGTEVLTRDHVAVIEHLASKRWFGRCAVLHDERGEPREIYFWGFSGD